MNRLFGPGMIVASIGLGTGTIVMASGLDEGRRLPAMQLEDINGNQIDTARYAEWIQVYCFADRHSSVELLAWMNEAGIEAMSRYPEGRFAYLGFADVTMVPDMFRHMAMSATTQMEEQAQAELVESFEERGMALDPERTAFHLVADWDGIWLDTFQIEDAQVFRCWTVHQGRVFGSYEGNSPDLTERYLSDVGRILEQ